MIAATMTTPAADPTPMPAAAPAPIPEPLEDELVDVADKVEVDEEVDEEVEVEVATAYVGVPDAVGGRYWIVASFDGAGAAQISLDGLEQFTVPESFSQHAQYPSDV